MINSAIGIYLLDFGRSQAFNIFIIASFVGALMYITLHITYNVLPKIFKKRQGGTYVCVCTIFILILRPFVLKKNGEPGDKATLYFGVYV